MKPHTFAPKLPLSQAPDSTSLDVVVPYTTQRLTRAALRAAGRFSADLLPLIRMVRMQVVPFPLQLETPPVSVAVLCRQLVPLAEEFGAHVQVCLARDAEEGLLQALAKSSVVVIAARRRWWKSREERLALRLRRGGWNVVLEFVEKADA